MSQIKLFVLSGLFLMCAQALDNGLVLKPPMGWMSWTEFLCETNCDAHPFSCISEDLYKAQAEVLAHDGYLDAGYEFIHIDDCWTESKRDPETKRLVSDKKRFSSGIPALADYIHSLGLKFGIYADLGTKTCMGLPGSIHYEKIDADTFAEWKVDYLKLDGCNSNEDEKAAGYPLFSKTLNESGRSIVYSCSWPAYLDQEKVNYTVLGLYCNLWRDFDDISNDWKEVWKIIQHYIELQDLRAETQGPGKWHDPDMLVIGNAGITEGMSRIQLTVWSIWSAPLIMSNDLRTITPEFKAILQNRDVIAVDQDPLGVFGKVVKKTDQLLYFLKKMTPNNGDDYSYAIAIINYSDKAVNASVPFGDFKLKSRGGYDLKCLWSGHQLGHYTAKSTLNTRLPPLDARLFKATIRQTLNEKQLKTLRESFAVGNDF
ncbi:Alpha-galactosidase [Aphelenchoides bicaudatus]|nr:Alpha-galactosidase [Aphelenchoides bicaudatus]